MQYDFDVNAGYKRQFGVYEMKEQISMLVDGEISSRDAMQLISQLCIDEELGRKWELYHLIGDSLRQHLSYPCNLSKKIEKQLMLEPAIVAPRKLRLRQPLLYLSAAASVAIFVAGTWVVLGGSPSPGQTRLSSEALPSAAANPKADISPYLLAHEEFTPASEIQGAETYIRSVSFQAGASQ